MAASTNVCQISRVSSVCGASLFVPLLADARALHGVSYDFLVMICRSVECGVADKKIKEYFPYDDFENSIDL